MAPVAMSINVKLSSLELELIEKILNNKIVGIKRNSMDNPTVAYAAWFDKGRIEFGRVRWGYKNNYHTDEGTYHSLSISPFPGAWAMVPVNLIVRISHVDAF